jgi:hypothetical protein
MFAGMEKWNPIFSCRILSSNLVVLKMAHCTFSNLSTETAGAIPLRLVTDVSQYPPHAAVNSA